MNKLNAKNLKSFGKAATLMTGLSAVAAGGLYSVNNDGVKRSATFWGSVAPIYAHYKYTEWMMKDASEEEQDAAFEALHDMYAGRTRDIVLELRGFFIKTAQLASMQDNMVPDQYMKFFKTLQDQVPPSMGPAEVVDVVEESLGQPLSEVFSEFDPRPMASATIGQVHRATLRETGEKVAVKVQYPNAEEGFENDLDLMISFCKLALPQHVSPLEEMRNQFRSEFDYSEEAKLLDEIHSNLKSEWSDQVVVPKSHPKFCRKNVLVMDMLQGIKLVDGIKRQYEQIATSMGKTFEELEAESKLNGVKMPSAFQMKMYISLIKLRDIFFNIPRVVYNWTASYTLGLKPLPMVKSDRPLNIPAIVQLLLDVHAYQLFVNGTFNADPHPGNVLLLDDGRLGLIDFGQVGRINDVDRVKLANIMIALSEDDKEEVVRVYTEDMGHASKKNDKDILYKRAAFALDRESKDITQGLNVLQFLDHVEAQDPIVTIPPNWVMAGRMALVLRGFGNAFNMDLSIAKCFKGQAQSFLKESPLVSAAGAA
jgi:aarF domain-containing kinase